jgi:hypothetical protein
MSLSSKNSVLRQTYPLSHDCANAKVVLFDDVFLAHYAPQGLPHEENFTHAMYETLRSAFGKKNRKLERHTSNAKGYGKPDIV